MTPEFPRLIDIRQIGPAPVVLTANADERAALAARFGLVCLEDLEARLTLSCEGDVVTVNGRMSAAWTQPCAVSGEDLPQRANETIQLRFVPRTAASQCDEEIELTEAECDEIDYTGHTFDLGEAVAQSLGLAIDPFACGPEAEEARRAAGILSEGASGPFAALAGLKLKKD